MALTSEQIAVRTLAALEARKSGAIAAPEAEAAAAAPAPAPAASSKAGIWIALAVAVVAIIVAVVWLVARPAQSAPTAAASPSAALQVV